MGNWAPESAFSVPIGAVVVTATGSLTACSVSALCGALSPADLLSSAGGTPDTRGTLLHDSDGN